MTVEDFIAEWQSPVSYFIAHTSGSTGEPKEIKIDKRFAEASAKRTNRFFGITSDSHLHLCLSPDYIAGKMMIIRALTAGAAFSYEEPSNKPLQGFNRQIKLLAVVPSQVEYLLSCRELLMQVDNLLVGGSAIPFSLRQKIADSGVKAYESYGMTETASHIALRRIVEDTTLPFETFPDITVSLGSHENLVIDMPDKQIVTRDVAKIVDSRHFFILGRMDNAIISGGVKIHPEEVERIIEKYLSDKAYFITSLPDDKWGERVVLCIEGDVWQDEELMRLKSDLSAALPSAQRPKEIRFIQVFKRTSTGKLIRRI
jgi:O-succinylbenzoic acid--CoA ligase